MHEVRRSFNGGEIRSELQWRNDLKGYYNSCLTLTNMLPTPYGSVVSRPPMKALNSSITNVNDPDRLRQIPFKYSESLSYIVVIHANGASQVDISVFLSDGTLKDTIAAVDYPIATLYKIQYVHSGDMLFLVHPDKPVRRLERRGDTDWVLVDHEVLGGPWLPPNIKKQRILTATPDVYDASTDYSAGDCVYVRYLTFVVSSLDYIYWYYDYGSGSNYDGLSGFGPRPDSDVYKLRITLTATHTFAVGDIVDIQGLDEYNGLRKVLAVDTVSRLWFEVDAGIYRHSGTWYNKYSPTIDANSKVSNIEGGFFESIADSNTGNSPMAGGSTYWRHTSAFRGAVTLQSSEDDFFSSDMVGAKFEISPTSSDYVSDGTFTATGDLSQPIPATGLVKLTTSGGRWGGTIALQESQDGGATWNDIGEISSDNADYNGSIERTIENAGSMVRAYMTSYVAPTSNPTGCQWKIELLETRVPTVLTITAYVSGSEVTCQTETYMFAVEPTWRWAEGAFSPKNGYPSAIAIFEERMVLSGTAAKPMVLYMSATNDWTNFFPGTLATSPMTIAPPSALAETTLWMLAKEELVFGTDSAIYTAGPRDATRGLSTDNARIKRRARVGASPVMPVEIGNDIFFVGFGGETLYALSYQYDADQYQVEDMTLIAPAVASGGIRQIAVTRTPWPVIWTTSVDGVWASFTFDRKNQVHAWARHDWDYPPDGMAVGVVSIPDGSEDALVVLAYQEDTGRSFDPGGGGLYKLAWPTATESQRAALDLYVSSSGPTATADVIDAHLTVIGDGAKKRWGTDWWPGSGSLVLASAPAGQTLEVIFTGSYFNPEADEVRVEYGASSLVLDPVSGYSYDPDTYTFTIPSAADTQYTFRGDPAFYSLSQVKLGGVTLVEGVDFTWTGDRYAVKLSGSSEYVVGVPSTVRITPTVLLPPQETLGEVSRISEVDLYLLNSKGGRVSLDGGTTWQEILNLEGDSTLPGGGGATAPTGPWINGRKRLVTASNFTRDPAIMIETSDGFRFELAALGVIRRKYGD